MLKNKLVITRRLIIEVGLKYIYILFFETGSCRRMQLSSNRDIKLFLLSAIVVILGWTFLNLITECFNNCRFSKFKEIFEIPVITCYFKHQNPPNFLSSKNISDWYIKFARLWYFILWFMLRLNKTIKIYQEWNRTRLK